MDKDRIHRIRDYIDAHGEATVSELAALCNGCSTMTLWRDLNKLEQEGAIRRTRGGAIAMRLVQPDQEGVYSQRAMENVEAKMAIAKAAAFLVRPGSALYLDAGSTLMFTARALPDMHITVVTSAANIALELVRRRHCDVILLGGQVSAGTLSCSGTPAEAALESLNIDTALMAASGFSLTAGFSCGSASESRLKRAILQKAAHSVMLMDSSKLGHDLTFSFATLADVGKLICEAPLPADVTAAAQAAGTELLLAASR